MRTLLAIAGIAVLTLAVFRPVRHYDFVDYDDPWFVVEHPVVSRGLSVASVRWAFDPANAYVGTGGPLTWLSHMLDVKLFGLRPGPHHLVSLALHTLNSVLLLVVLWRMTGLLGRSACVAALFAVHPLHVESVAWIAERKDVLSMVFLMLTTLAYVRYVQQSGLARYAWVFFLFSLGLLAKPVVATLPFVLLLLDAWPLARAPLSWPDRHRWRPIVAEKLPLFALAVVVMMLTVGTQQEIGAISAASTVPWMLRLENAIVSYATYLLKAAWPAGLAVFYPYPATIPAWKTLLSLIVVATFSVVAWREARSRPYITVGWLWFVGTLIPMIGLVQVGSHAMADRFTYIPLIGVFIAIVWAAADAMASQRWPRLAVAGLACVVVGAAAIAARGQVSTWQNSETLWTQASVSTDGNFRAHAGLAEVAAARGDTARAIGHYKDAVRLAPDAAEWHVNVALLLSAEGQHADAAASFRRALALRPNDAESHNNLGAMLVRLSQMGEAVAHYRRALDLRPEYALARRNLGLAHAASGDLAGGVRECLEALRLSPNEAQWQYEVAVMLMRLDRTSEAVGHLREAVRLSPGHQAAADLLSQLQR
jgi:Flp pilus assembly protein TadD